MADDKVRQVEFVPLSHVFDGLPLAAEQFNHDTDLVRGDGITHSLVTRKDVGQTLRAFIDNADEDTAPDVLAEFKRAIRALKAVPETALVDLEN